MTEEPRITELLSFADDLELSDAERMRLALILCGLLDQSWQEGWTWGWYAGADDVLFRGFKHTARIISH